MSSLRAGTCNHASRRTRDAEALFPLFVCLTHSLQSQPRAVFACVAGNEAGGSNASDDPRFLASERPLGRRLAQPGSACSWHVHGLGCPAHAALRELLRGQATASPRRESNGECPHVSSDRACRSSSLASILSQITIA